ncbi:MAG: hypothetical protein WAT39_25685 [Planctomycetota bacterium]
MVRSAGDEWSGFHLGSGVVTLGAPGPIDVIVQAPRHRTAFVAGVFDARTIALEAAADARIAIELPSPLPEGATLRCRLTPAIEVPRRAHLQLDNGRGMTASTFFVEEVALDAEGRGTLPVRFPGSYTVEVSVSSGRESRPLGALEPPTIVLPGRGETVVKVPAKALERVLEARRR